MQLKELQNQQKNRWGFNPLHPNISIHILHTFSLYIYWGADKENLSNN